MARLAPSWRSSVPRRRLPRRRRERRVPRAAAPVASVSKDGPCGYLQNHGFLHVGNGHWRLAPAFDVNTFPDKDRESKTWLSEEHGPIVDVSGLLAHCRQFALDSAEAKEVLSEVYKAVVGWRLVAASAGVGLKPAELADFAPAFEHDQIAEARAAL